VAWKYSPNGSSWSQKRSSRRLSSWTGRRPQIPAQVPTILDHAAVGLRHARQRAVFRLAAASVEGFRRTLRAEHFSEIFTPKLVAMATEGGANVFAVDYFGRPAYLAQSPQFYKQMMVGVFERVFEVGPVFRAEPHDTPSGSLDRNFAIGS
jgi:nondiscriminating aspartyl-tRNA synthetase